MSDIERGQVSTAAAEVYETLFVPALFAPWSGPMIDAVGVQPGHRALDVGCGTGVLARALAQAVGADGSVTGVDVNEGMLAVARRSAPNITWRRGAAETLPFDDDAFDVVTSQFALMFFDDRAQGLREMHRVLRPGGRLAVAVWGALDDTPGYAAMHALLQRLFGKETARALEAPYDLGDRSRLDALLSSAGLQGEIRTLDGQARFPSLTSWLETDIRGWTLADSIDDAQFDRLVDASQSELSRFVQPDGTVAFAAPAHIAVIAAQASA